MLDLALGVVLLFIASVGLFVLAAKVCSRLPRAGRIAVALVSAVAIGLFALFLHGRPIVARLLPFSNAIVLGNWFPLGAAVLAAVAWRQDGTPLWRRALAVAALAAIAGRSILAPLAGAECRVTEERMENGVCIQSGSSSCSPAAAATLLRYYDIDTSEAEMARLCLTNDRGTALLGLYRGLSIKTRGTPYTVEVFHTDVDGLRAGPAAPAVLSVGLPSSEGVDPRYERDWGWTPGRRHTIVFFRFQRPRRVRIGDPSVGVERWDESGLETLWNGEGMRLVPRRGPRRAMNASP
jgi:hypothetical protein